MIDTKEAAMFGADHHPRRGISLLEVLISIGILAIGLTSVVALVPAGRSTAMKAIVFDRAAQLAENAMADAATFGLLKLPSLGITSGTGVMVIDNLPTAPALGVFSAVLPQRGVYELGANAGQSASAAATRLFTQSRDDVVAKDPVADDDLPIYLGTDGVRDFNGSFTCLFAIAPVAGSLSAGALGRLSVVVFHRRQNDALVVSGTWNLDFTLSFTPPAGLTGTDVIKPGTVIFWNNRFYQTRAATLEAGTNGSVKAHVMLAGVLPTSGTASILLDSVGLAERVVMLEGGGPYSQ